MPAMRLLSFASPSLSLLLIIAVLALHGFVSHNGVLAAEVQPYNIENRSPAPDAILSKSALVPRSKVLAKTASKAPVVKAPPVAKPKPVTSKPAPVSSKPALVSTRSASVSSKPVSVSTTPPVSKPTSASITSVSKSATAITSVSQSSSTLSKATPTSSAVSSIVTSASNSTTVSSSTGATPSSTDAPSCALKRGSPAGAGAVAACEQAQELDDFDGCDGEVPARKRKRSEDDDIRKIYGNETVTFQPGEGIVERHITSRNNQIVFDCSATGIPEVCQNMCYAINCKGFPSTLTIAPDRSKSTCEAVRRQNACKRPNRCSPIPGENCDEYPFASTVEGQSQSHGTTVTRCVPVGQNSSQGNKLKTFYKSNTGAFDVEFDFGGPQAVGTGYCNPVAAARQCNVLTGNQLPA